MKKAYSFNIPYYPASSNISKREQKVLDMRNSYLTDKNGMNIQEMTASELKITFAALLLGSLRLFGDAPYYIRLEDEGISIVDMGSRYVLFSSQCTIPSDWAFIMADLVINRPRKLKRVLDKHPQWKWMVDETRRQLKHNAYWFWWRT